MKKIILSMIAACAIFTSCYDDKGGNDFDSVLPDVKITIPESAYSASLGETITITPQIKSEIDESDLEYHWEVLGVQNKYQRNDYCKLVSDDQQARELSYVCHLDSCISALNTSYKCRLHVKQKSTGRDFYSDDTFTITIAGVTGLMVLHDDGSKSDVGIVEADEFMPSSNSLPASPVAIPELYSANNEGAKIDGVGKSIIQGVVEYISYYSADTKARCRISVMTDKDALFANMTDLSKYGDWNSIFYLQGDRAVNANKPKAFSPLSQIVYAFDGDDVFVMQLTQTYPFLLPEFTPASVAADGHCYTFEPVVQAAGTGSVQGIMYANSVDGDSSHKGFVVLGATYYGSNGTWRNSATLMDTRNDLVKFNPGDMHASLVKMNWDSRSHILAVMKGEAGSGYDGKFFGCDIYPEAGGTGTGESTYDATPKYLYDFSSLPEVNDAKWFDFGSTQNMCYYATASGVYHYSMVDGNMGPGSRITMYDGSAINIEGEVTMMKMLKSPCISTHFEDEILLVATYTGSNAKIYCIYLEDMTGNAKKVVKYDESTVSGWNFGRIRDVNIKGM